MYAEDSNHGGASQVPINGVAEMWEFGDPAHKPLGPANLPPNGAVASFYRRPCQWTIVQLGPIRTWTYSKLPFALRY